MLDLFNEEVTFITSVIGCILLAVFLLIEEKKQEKFYNLITNKFWVINAILIIIFYLFVNLSHYINNKSEKKKDRSKIKDASQKAMIAFIIAVFSSIDITIVPFWFVFSFAYFTELV